MHAEDTIDHGNEPGPATVGVGANTASEVPGLIERLEQAKSLDTMAEVLWEVLPDWVVTGWGRELLGGTWLGHSRRPLLTDLPVGCWSSATLLDLLDLLDLLGGGRGRYADASRRLVGFGLLASPPTAAAGLSDWSRLETRARRVGLVHGQLNTLALVLYGASYPARRRRGSGVALGVVGSFAMAASGYLGGHLATTRAVTRDNRLLDVPMNRS